MLLNTEIQSIKKKLFKARFENELISLEPIEDNKERIEQLQEIIEDIDKRDNNNQKGYNTKHIEKYFYKKPWTRLNPFHKSVKIKEYMSGMNLDKSIKEEITRELVDHVNNKKLNKKKCVVYDPTEEKIVSIPALSIKSDGSYTISLI